ncbi:hypothetical protein GCM10011318_16540 [Phaeocystidibacter marisrubri]|uniref:DUF349 domain-containing protein n=2 Tax=Phaeocystidibacter marisrubri TaxID=1577780 RepID=A0A6L3ZK06_9FLAO|nr:DUF349 domain-containing protein [Phaeocystidibacter marisrubri]GGH72518.1 hypothetical protein GCM10011318_16540 [Phaeocystidibacter marisrubri]
MNVKNFKKDESHASESVLNFPFTLPPLSLSFHRTTKDYNMSELEHDENKKVSSEQTPETPSTEGANEQAEAKADALGETAETSETPSEESEDQTVEATAPEEKAEVAQDAKNEEEDEDDDHEEDLHTDEHEEDDQYEGQHDELPDYDHESNEKLLAAAEHWSKHDDLKSAKNHIEAIRTALLKRLDEERNEKKEEFLANGGVEIDFQYDQADRRKFRTFYSTYKERRRNARKQLEEQLQNNLNVKRSIIDAVKEIPGAEGSAQEKYKRFRELQDRWRDTGPVPRAESRDLYNNYHFHVDQFYDFLRISNELRELDFKKNQAAKEALIAEAEKLAGSEVNPEMFASLQRLHKSWKEIGPVERDIRDAMWEKFSEATKLIHDKRHKYYEGLKTSREERLAKKAEYVDQMAAMDLSKIKSHRDWQKAIQQMNEWRDAFKKLGRIHLPGNDELWERYSDINRNFNKTKNNFYKELKREQRENLDKKKALLDRAIELKDSTDWREAANELKALQRKWKTIGFAPRAESDKIWNEFRAACNQFFERLKDKNSEQDAAYEGNYTKKTELLEKVKAFDPVAADRGVDALKGFIEEWKSLGSVPRAKKDIEGEFNAILDKHFSALKIDKKESAMIRFENRLHHIAQDGDQRSMDKEYHQLRRKIDEAEKELRQLENNMGFFANSDPKNPLVREAQKNIDRHKEQIELLKDKLRLLNKIDEEGTEE